MSPSTTYPEKTREDLKMTEVELAKIMRGRNLSVVGEIPIEEKRRNMVKTLCIIIPPKRPYDRLTFRNVVRFFTENSARGGRRPDEMFRILIDFALPGFFARPHLLQPCARRYQSKSSGWVLPANEGQCAHESRPNGPFWRSPDSRPVS